MAIIDFYTQVIIIAIGGAGVLGVLWKNCIDIIDKLEGSASEEGYLIISRIWATNIKDSVEEFFSFIQKNIMESESKDKYAELFGDKEKIDTLKDRLDRVDKSYKSYLDFNNLFPNWIHETEETKKWLIRTICLCFGFAILAATGFLIETQGSFFIPYRSLFWGVLVSLICLTTLSIGGIIKHTRKCGLIKSTIRREKTKYGSAIEKAV